MVDMLAGTNYVLRPIYDEVIAELGAPPLGFPAECEFAWPVTPDEEIDALAAELVAAKQAWAETRSKVARDDHGRFVKRSAE